MKMKKGKKRNLELPRPAYSTEWNWISFVWRTQFVWDHLPPHRRRAAETPVQVAYHVAHSDRTRSRPCTTWPSTVTRRPNRICSPAQRPRVALCASVCGSQSSSGHSRRLKEDRERENGRKGIGYLKQATRLTNYEVSCLFERFNRGIRTMRPCPHLLSLAFSLVSACLISMPGHK